MEKIKQLIEKLIWRRKDLRLAKDWQPAQQRYFYFVGVRYVNLFTRKQKTEWIKTPFTKQQLSTKFGIKFK